MFDLKNERFSYDAPDDNGYNIPMATQITKKQDVKHIKYVIYTRVSDIHQLEGVEIDSTEKQKEYCQKYVAYKNDPSVEQWKYVGTYVDNGRSGGNLNRPEMKKMISDWEESRFNCIVTYKLDRLTRSIRDFYELHDTFLKPNKIEIVSVTQEFNTATSAGRMMLHMLLTFAQYEREINSERTKESLLTKIKHGGWPGGYPLLGYKLIKNKDNYSDIVVDKNEAIIVRKIFDYYIETPNMLTVAKQLNKEGLQTKKHTSKKGNVTGGTKFDKFDIKRIITNPIYIGKYLIKDDDNSIAKANKDEVFLEANGVNLGDWNQNFRIVTDQQFFACQLAYKSHGNSANARQSKHNYLLKGAIYYDNHPKPMTGYSSKSGKYFAYEYVDIYGNKKRLPRDKFEAQLISEIKGLILNENKIKFDALIQNTKAYITETTKNIRDEIQVLTNRITVNNKEISKLALGNNGKSVTKIIEQKITSLTEANTRLTAQRDAKQNQLARIKDKTINPQKIKQNFKNFVNKFEKADFKAKEDVLSWLIEKLHFDTKNDKVTIYFNDTINTPQSEMGRKYAYGYGWLPE